MYLCKWINSRVECVQKKDVNRKIVVASLDFIGEMSNNISEWQITKEERASQNRSTFLIRGIPALLSSEFGFTKLGRYSISVDKFNCSSMHVIIIYHTSDTIRLCNCYGQIWSSDVIHSITIANVDIYQRCNTLNIGRYYCFNSQKHLQLV